MASSRIFSASCSSSPTHSSPSISSSWALRLGPSLWRPTHPPFVKWNAFRRPLSVAASASRFANENREYVIVGGGNAAGYAAMTFVEHGMANGRLCIVSKEVLYEDPVVGFDIQNQTLATSSGKLLKYGSLIISTGCSALRFPEKIGGDLPGVHYIRNVADADSLVSSLERSKKIVVIGGGYIGMEVAAAAAGWSLDTTVIFPENNIMSKLFTPSIAQRYEELYQENGVKFLKGVLIDKIESGSDGRAASVVLKSGSKVEADTVIVGIGAKPVVSPFEAVGLNSSVGGIQVDSLFRTAVPGIFAIGDVAAFPLKIYDRMARVEHVDHARKSAQHCVRTLLTAHAQPYDYLPYFYSRVFEYEGSPRKVWWQFYGDNVGEIIEVGEFDPKLAAFWVDSDSWLKGIFLESGNPEEFSILPNLAKAQPLVDKAKLKSASSVEDALDIARNWLKVGSAA